jgi:hypothetical protein
MQHYAFDDYGLVLDKETVKIIASKVFDDYKENESATALAYDFYDRGICEYISEFTGEAQELDGQGLYWGGDSIEYYSDIIAYIQATNYPTLFRKAYNNMDELVEEFKNKIGEYLPENFDYRSRIRHICGTYFG